MIIILSICSILLAQGSSPTDSKGTPIPPSLLKKISVDFKETSLRETFSSFSEKSGINLIFDDNIIPANCQVSLNLKDVPAVSVLQEMLKDTRIEFIVSKGDHIILNNPNNTTKEIKFTISGFIFDEESGEALIGGNIYIENSRAGCVSNNYGFYSLTIPAGQYKIVYDYIGYEQKYIQLMLDRDKEIIVELKPSIFSGDTIVVTAEAEENFIKSTEIGSIKLAPKDLTRIPILFGEQDILKTIQLLPGVTLSNEGSSGFHVRGGNSDQNLVLLDEAAVYNAFHFFGFFSVFNSDAIKDVKLIKGSTPPKYGGRLSSVLDVQMNEGNFKEFKGNGGVGLIFSRLTLEGPIVKDKSSYIISGRRTYADLFTFLSTEEEAKKSSLYFYDFNIKTNYRMSNKDRLYLSGYFGRDVLGFSEVFRNSWGNETATLRWNHLFSDKLFLNSSLIFSDFSYSMNIEPESETEGNENPENQNEGEEIKISNNINAFTIKEDFQYFLDSRNTFNFGLNYIFYEFLPGKINISGGSNFNLEVGKRKAREGSIYVAHEYEATERLKINYGLRYFNFDVGRKRDVYNLIEVEDFPDVTFRGKEEKYYKGLEPRITANYKWDENTSFKLGYARNYQNVHILSNSTSGVPFDIWQPSSARVKPQRADQISLGYFRNFENDTYNLSIELFYKDMRNQTDFKNGANLWLSSLFESELVFGTAQAYGVELLLKKKLGKLTGWIGYSLSKTTRKFDEINQGKPFPPKYDRTHDFSLVSMYKLNHKWSLSANWVYYTGNAITIPYGKYQINGKIIDAYTDRNAYRLPAYHRLDINVTYTTNGGNFWNFSCYNAYGRKNAYAILFMSNEPNPIKLSLFSFLPSISYNFKF